VGPLAVLGSRPKSIGPSTIDVQARLSTRDMALPLPVIPQQPDAFHLAPHRIKRCTFRRLINVEVGNERIYDVECLYPDRKVPIPLGDLDAAAPICNSCAAPHIFRPDED
jgi:hypothetical protein